MVGKLQLRKLKTNRKWNVADTVRARYRRVRAWLFSRSLNAAGDFAASEGELKASSEVSIVVPVHDAPEFTARCIRSLERFSGGAEVIFVDDASKNLMVTSMVERVCTRNRWQYMRNLEPVGHSRATEMGALRASRNYLCLLNSDTVVTQHSWQNVVQAFVEYEDVEIVGPSTSNTFGPQQSARAYHCRHYWTDEQIWAFAQTYVQNNAKMALEEVPFVGGFAFFVRRRTWESLGGFDKSLRDYGNETEFCKRVIQNGGRVVWTRGAYIHHFGSASYGTSIGIDVIRERCVSAAAYIRAKHGIGEGA